MVCKGSKAKSEGDKIACRVIFSGFSALNTVAL